MYKGLVKILISPLAMVLGSLITWFSLIRAKSGKSLAQIPRSAAGEWPVLHLLYLLAKCHQKFEFSELKFFRVSVCVVILASRQG